MREAELVLLLALAEAYADHVEQWPIVVFGQLLAIANQPTCRLRFVRTSECEYSSHRRVVPHLALELVNYAGQPVGPRHRGRSWPRLALASGYQPTDP